MIIIGKFMKKSAVVLKEKTYGHMGSAQETREDIENYTSARDLLITNSFINSISYLKNLRRQNTSNCQALHWYIQSGKSCCTKNLFNPKI